MKKLVIALISAIICSSLANADERTYEAQAALKALGYKVGAVDGSWGKNTEQAVKEFADSSGIPFDGELTPELWVNLSAAAKSSFPMPYLQLKKPLEGNGSTDLLVSGGQTSKPENCSWLVDFYQDQSWGRGQPVTLANYKGAFKSIVLLDVSKNPNYFEDISNEMHDSLIATNQACFSGNDAEACQVAVDVIRWMKDENAFVWNTEIDALGNDTFYYTTKRILNPALVAYSSAIEKLGKPDDHLELGNWFYATLIQNSFDVFSPKKARQRDMLFYAPADGVRAACEKHNLSFNHSLYQALGLSFYGSIWEDQNLGSQAYDRLLYSLKTGALSKDGVLLCEASRGSNAMMYSGSTMLNILYTIKLARNQGINIETPKVVSEVEKAGSYLMQSAFDFSKLEPFASENRMSWCDEDYKNQCMYNAFGRIGAFSWMRHFVELYPDSELSKKILNIRAAPAANDEEGIRVSGAIAKSNFMISEVDWILPVENDDGHEAQTRSANGPQFLNIFDANLVSNVCAVPVLP